jgi:hypothetical protein
MVVIDDRKRERRFCVVIQLKDGGENSSQFNPLACP